MLVIEQLNGWLGAAGVRWAVELVGVRTGWACSPVLSLNVSITLTLSLNASFTLTFPLNVSFILTLMSSSRQQWKAEVHCWLKFNAPVVCRAWPNCLSIQVTNSLWWGGHTMLGP